MKKFDSGGERVFQVATGIVGLLALMLNLYRIGVPAALVDEPTYALAGWRYVHGETFPPGQGGALGSLADNFEHPPLGKYLFGLGQLVAGGPGITAGRVVTAIATLGAAALMGFWLGRLTDQWTGLTVAGLIACAPMTVPPSIVRFGRMGMLDSVAVFFVVAAMVLAWTWSVRSGRGALRWAAFCGLGAGLASSAKETGILVLVGPCLLVLWHARGSAARLRARFIECVVLALTALITFLASYLPVGHPLDRIAMLWEFQTRHSRLGHPVVLNGELVAHPPWWANLWFAATGLGTIITALLTIGVVAALALRRDRLVAFLGACLLAPMAFFFIVAGVTLPFYWTMWMAPAFAVGVLGWRALFDWVGQRVSLRWVTPALVTAVLIGMAIPVASAMGTTLELELAGIQKVPQVMRANSLQGPLITTGVTTTEQRAYLNGFRIKGTPAEPGSADAIVVGAPVCGQPRDRVMAAFVALNLKRRTIRPLYEDSKIVIYGRTGELQSPGYLDIVTIKTPHC